VMPAKREPDHVSCASMSLLYRARAALLASQRSKTTATREHTQSTRETRFIRAVLLRGRRTGRGEREGHAPCGAGSVDGRMGDPCGGGVAARLAERSLRFRRRRSQRRQPYTSSPTASAAPSTVRSSRCVYNSMDTHSSANRFDPFDNSAHEFPTAFQYRAEKGEPLARETPS